MSDVQDLQSLSRDLAHVSHDFASDSMAGRLVERFRQECHNATRTAEKKATDHRLVLTCARCADDYRAEVYTTHLCGTCRAEGWELCKREPKKPTPPIDGVVSMTEPTDFAASGGAELTASEVAQLRSLRLKEEGR